MTEATIHAADRPALPDRLSVDPRSHPPCPRRVRPRHWHPLRGKECRDVEEYCVSEGWVKVPSPKTVDRKGQTAVDHASGAVEVFYR